MYKERKPDEPIINSRLQVDFYKFTMGQLIFRRHSDVRVYFAFKCRTEDVKLGRILNLDELRVQLDHYIGLRFTHNELHYLRGMSISGRRMFSEEYLGYLALSVLPEYFLDVDADGNLILEIGGLWKDVSQCETAILAIVTALYNEAVLKPKTRVERAGVYMDGMRRLDDKLRLLRMNPDIQISDFGHRRAWDPTWHEYVLGNISSVLNNRLQFRGTSNTYLAWKTGLPAMGTNAHEMPMGYSAIYRDLDSPYSLLSQKRFLSDWEQEYGSELTIALSDTYGSKFFFERIMDMEKIRSWKGSRHDSGDPFMYADSRIAMYQALDVDPREKLIVFSDGLDLATIMALEQHCRGRIQASYGWGSNLTCDMGLRNLSTVCKLVDVNGSPVCKLSDNKKKAVGSPKEISRMKWLVGYETSYSEACRY